jgi:hypothetical protein
MPRNRTRLTVDLILAWCDDHRARTGQWPRRNSGPVAAAPGEVWVNVDEALKVGCRGLPGGLSLARLLARRRGVPYRYQEPGSRLTLGQILAWARQHRQRTGAWPDRHCGPIAGTGGETWTRVDQALLKGLRGLPGGDTLARLLARRCGVPAGPPALTIEQILSWADRHRERTGAWPHAEAGPVPGVPGETWGKLNLALGRGLSGLPGGSTLARLLAERRGRRLAPPLTVAQILAWADLHHGRTGRWPSALSGPVADAPGENWHPLDTALQRGGRGLPGGTSLARLLVQCRGHRAGVQAAPLTVGQILAWADRHYQRTGRWPTFRSGPVADAPGEKCRAINQVLQRGHRGLPGGGSLARLLREHRRGAGRDGETKGLRAPGGDH